MPKHFCFIQQHTFICLHASVGFQLSKRRTWVMPFFDTGCWCWLFWNSNIVDVDSVVECYKKKFPWGKRKHIDTSYIDDRNVKQESGQGKRSEALKRCLDSWTAEGVAEKHRMLSRDMFIHVNQINLRIGRQPSGAGVSAVASQQGLGRRHFCEELCSPLSLITVLSLTVHLPPPNADIHTCIVQLPG